MAESFLLQKGYEIIEKNYFSRSGELDMVAREGGCLVFVEVKYRKNRELGTPEEAVDQRKIQSIVRTARYYMLRHGILEDTPCRFDVVAMLGKEINLIQNAFDSLY